jgi:hypothetical protein
MTTALKVFSRYFTSILILSTVALNTQAQGKSEATPWIEVKIPAEWQDDYDYKSDVVGNERNNMSLKLEPEATINILPVPGLSLFAHGVLEQVVDPDPDEDRYFKDAGFFVEDLFIRYETGRFAFLGGKTNPGFGIAWDKASGIYGTDMAEDYEIAERIVLSASAGFDAGALGNHNVSIGTFFLDTSPLQNTIVSRTRGTLGREDGGVSNTGDFSSYNIVLEGGFPAAKDLLYHLAYIHQANGEDALDNETGFAAGVTTRLDLGNDVAVTPLLEYVRLEDLGGTKDTNQRYWTGSLLTEWRSWNLALAYTNRKLEASGASDISDYQFQASIGYAFDNGITADLGWKRLRESSETTDRIGFLFTYEFGFKK